MLSGTIFTHRINGFKRKELERRLIHLWADNIWKFFFFKWSKATDPWFCHVPLKVFLVCILHGVRAKYTPHKRVWNLAKENYLSFLFDFDDLAFYHSFWRREGWFCVNQMIRPSSFSEASFESNSSEFSLSCMNLESIWPLNLEEVFAAGQKSSANVLIW
jgi:hypothetical protein